jgi:hypothetical protein
MGDHCGVVEDVNIEVSIQEAASAVRAIRITTARSGIPGDHRSQSAT